MKNKLKLGDKKVVQGVKCEVRFTNGRGHAWLFPVVDSTTPDGLNHPIHIAFAVIHPNGNVVRT